MPAKKTQRKAVGRKPTRDDSKGAPKSSRPLMPKVYGIPTTMKGSLPWDWACDRLTDSHNHLLITVRPDSRPHAMVVWGIWLENAYYFSTGPTTRKSKNLAANPNCIVCNDNVEEAVIVEGEARQLGVPDIPEKAFALYQKKYGWKLDPEMGPVFKVTPRAVFAMPEELFPAGATRWLFE
ncbi:MAG TPA: pyridoxamine 5'-phosphate oxidase family protein [Terriglobales bacterium]